MKKDYSFLGMVEKREIKPKKTGRNVFLSVLFLLLISYMLWPNTEPFVHEGVKLSTSSWSNSPFAPMGNGVVNDNAIMTSALMENEKEEVKRVRNEAEIIVCNGLLSEQLLEIKEILKNYAYLDRSRLDFLEEFKSKQRAHDISINTAYLMACAEPTDTNFQIVKEIESLTEKLWTLVTSGNETMFVQVLPNDELVPVTSFNTSQISIRPATLAEQEQLRSVLSTGAPNLMENATKAFELRNDSEYSEWAKQFGLVVQPKLSSANPFKS
jgi:hypothetical protein